MVDELKNNKKIVEQKTMKESSKESRKPVAKIRSGQVTISVWEQEKQNSDGSKRVFHTLSFQKSYKDKKGEWHNVSSFLPSDLSDIVFACIRADSKLN